MLRDWDTPTIVYVTACTSKRKPWLATIAHHDGIRDVWRNAAAWMVGRYVIMPDHLHFFAAPGNQDVGLETWIRYWKRLFRKAIRDRCYRWQGSHWDTRLRSSESYEEKWEYVRQNPVRHGLVAHADDWPYAGEIHELDW